MTEDLLIKEKGFRQLNEELEQKAHNLMEKIDYAINTYNNEYSACDPKTHSNFVEENITAQTENNTQICIKRNSSLPYIFRQLSPPTSKVETQKEIVNEASTKRSLANKTVINLFKSKIDILQNELQTIQTEYKKKCEICKNLESEKNKLEVKLQNEVESLKETVTKLECANKELQCQYQTINAENLMMKKDLDKLEKELKVSNQRGSNYNTRLNRSLEINEKLKSALRCSQAEEKELRNQIRKLQDDKRLTINNLGKQLSELVQVLKKQMLIIDNLKKQNVSGYFTCSYKISRKLFYLLIFIFIYNQGMLNNNWTIKIHKRRFFKIIGSETSMHMINCI
nr:PREDICTED: testis-specific gene 10 protein isoform X1 [Megachile rotundata]